MGLRFSLPAITFFSDPEFAEGFDFRISQMIHDMDYLFHAFGSQ